MKENDMNLLHFLHPRDVAIASILFVVFTAAWVAGFQGFVGWTSLVLVPIVLAAHRVVESRTR